MRPFIRIIFILIPMLCIGTLNSHTAERKEIVVVMPISSPDISEGMRTSLTDSFVGELTRSGKYEIRSGKIVAEAMKAAFKKQASKKEQCDETACIKEVADNFGTDLILTIKVIKEEETFFLNAKIENINSGAQVSQKDDECKKCDLSELKKKIKLLAARLMGLEGWETAPAIAVKKPAAEEPRGSSFSLDDLERRAQEEAKQKEVEKAEWNNKTKKMQGAFNQVMEYQKRDVSPDLKISAWKRFIETFTEENPYSQEDDTMRGKAREQISYWENPPSPPFAKGGTGGLGDMVFIKGGCFQMGDTFGDGDSNEKPVHEVCVDDFYIGKYEVTQKEWQAVMGNNPSYFKNCDNCPVEGVSWDDAQEYISKLTIVRLLIE